MQSPVMPTAWPLSLMAKTNPSGSPPIVGSSCSISPFSQITGLSSSCTEGDGQVGSGVVFSTSPATWPLLLIPIPNPLLPPSVGSGTMRPSRQRNGRHIRLPLTHKSSPNGSGVEVSAVPTTSPLSLRDIAPLFGPPSVPRSLFTPLLQRKAWLSVSPGRFAAPTTEPLLLTALAWPNVPPKVPRSVTV